MKRISVVKEQRGYDLWSDLGPSFAKAAGVPYEKPVALGPPSAFEKAFIGLDAFCGLLVAEGDGDLSSEKMKEMFDSVDTDKDGLIEFVQVYKAINDEADSRRPNFFLGFFGGGGDS